MNWLLAAAAPLLVGAVFMACGFIHPAILAYHGLCAVVVVRQRARVRTLLKGGRSTSAWVLGTTILVVGPLLAAPLMQDPAPFRELFLRTLFPRGQVSTLFALFAAYTLVVHAPLEEIFWRAVVLDPDRGPLPASIAGNAFFFYLLHAIPMTLVLGARGLLFAVPTLAAGAIWSWVTIRSRSLWPGLLSHWAADALLLAGMWAYFVRPPL